MMQVPILTHKPWLELTTTFRLTGITIMQAYHYFPSKDRPVVQLIVRWLDYHPAGRPKHDSTPGPLHACLGSPFRRPRCSGPQLLPGRFSPLQLSAIHLIRYTASTFWFNNTPWSSRSVGTPVVMMVRLLTRFLRALGVECVATTFIIVM